jgi:hypothetical protein
MRNGQYRDAGNIGHMTQNQDNEKKKNNIENWKYNQHGHTNKQGWTQVLAKFFFIRHPPCYS